VACPLSDLAALSVTNLKISKRTFADHDRGKQIRQMAREKGSMDTNRKGTPPGASSLNQKTTTRDYFCNLQFEDTTATDELQCQLVERLSQYKRVRKLVRCFGCGQPRSPVSMSAVAGICRCCVVAFREKGRTAQNNFIERSKANVGRFLRRCLG